MNDAKKNAAPGLGAAKGNTTSVNGKSDNSTGADKLTVLKTRGPVLTKTYKSDGTTEPYGDAASFDFHVQEVKDLKALAKLLGKLHKHPQRCLIAGAPLADPSKMAPGQSEGSIARTNANFTDQPLHSFVIDIDGYEPGFADPVHEPELAVLDFINDHLPECFKTASFYWHLSSSAGMPGKERVLKCHVWLWSKTAYTTAQYYAWASNEVGRAIDRAVYRRVQCRYTADPIFEEGRIDPVPVRCGWHQGETDYVDLVIRDDVLADARSAGAGSGSGDMKLTDPSSKEGLIGAFHRAFDAERVLLDFLEGEFEQATERRYTWLNGGGTPEGVWVHEDGMHVHANHNTWPCDSIANLWDLARVFKFGSLDIAGEDADDFDRLNIEQAPVGRRPSDVAMRKWAEGLPELKAAVAAEQAAEEDAREAALQALLGKIAAADSSRALHVGLLPELQAALRENAFMAHELAELEAAFSKRSTALSPAKAKLSPKQVRELLSPPDEEVVRTADLELALVRQVLVDWFEGGKHLKRFGKTWWLYRGGVWRMAEDELVQNRVHRSLQRLLSGANRKSPELVQMLQESERGNMFANLTSAVYANLVRAMAREDKADDPLGLNGHAAQSVANCKNGELWFADDGSFEFAEHDPAHCLTHQLATDYDPSADCPIFKATLADIFAGYEDPAAATRHWLELMGTLIQPRRLVASWAMMRGPGANGKTLLVEVIEALLGHDACVKGSIAEATMDRHFTAQLVGKLAFIDDDVEKGVKLPDGWIKKLSEEKQLTANPKNRDAFTFTSRATLVMLTNPWPSTSDISEGMQRRAHIFELCRVIPEEKRDPLLKRRIVEAELPGVLNLLIAGWQRVIRRGRYDVPPEILEAKERWLRAGNKTRSFFGTMLRKHPGAAAVPVQQLFELYTQHHAETEPSARPIGRTAFDAELEAWSGEKIFDRRNQKHIRGVIVRMVEQQEDDERPTPDEQEAARRVQVAIDALRGNFDPLSSLRRSADDDFGGDS